MTGHGGGTLAPFDVAFILLTVICVALALTLHYRMTVASLLPAPATTPPAPPVALVEDTDE